MRHLAVAALAFAICGCSASPVAVPSASSSLSVVPATTPAVSARATPLATQPAATTSPSQTPFATPTPIVDVAQVFRPMTIGWRPTGTTLLFMVNGDRSSVLMALAIDAKGTLGPAIPLVEIAQGGLDVRTDGSAVAISVGMVGGFRLATYDTRTGDARWITSPDPDIGSPIWSKDGSTLYFASGPIGELKGAVYKIAADGSGKTKIADLPRFGDLRSLSPDGRSLVMSRGQEGGSADLIDISTGVDRDLADVARVASWRAQQPRILLAVGGCCAGRPGGSLVAFDDSTLTQRTVAERSANGTVAWSVGAWDPTGIRIAAGRFEDTTPYDASLVIIDGSGVPRAVPDMAAVNEILWIDEGIIATRAHARQIQTDLVLVNPHGGPPVVLYQGASIVNVRVVKP